LHPPIVEYLVIMLGTGLQQLDGPPEISEIEAAITTKFKVEVTAMRATTPTLNSRNRASAGELIFAQFLHVVEVRLRCLLMFLPHHLPRLSVPQPAHQFPHADLEM
jgi:hypothetical protein